MGLKTNLGFFKILKVKGGLFVLTTEVFPQTYFSFSTSSFKVIASGSAPLSPELHKNMQTILGCPIRVGYGLTETMALACIGEYDDFEFGVCGPPTECSMIRLADWDEGGYRNSDSMNPKIGMPRGEVLIGGPLVTMGYFVDDEDPDPDLVKKNSEDFITFVGEKKDDLNSNNRAFLPHGVRWFRTGDIGQINERGVLQIIDRKKDLWKGPSGEYVSFAKVENVLKLLPEIDNAMVYGQTGGAYCVLLVVPNEKALRRQHLVVEEGEETGMKTLCGLPSVIGKIENLVKDACKNGGLAAFETPTKIYLCSEPWTLENELLTAQLKLKRQLIAKEYAKEIDLMYAA